MIDGSFFGEPKQRRTKNHRKQSVWNAGPLPIWMICLFVNQTSVYLSKNDIKLTIVHLLIIQNDKIPNDITNVLCLSFVKFLKTLELDNIFIELLIYKVIGLMSTLQHYIIVPGHHPQETLHCKRQTRRQRGWRRRVIETEVKQELTDEHSLDEELRCCVKECSPADLCYILSPSFQPVQRVTKPAYVSIQQFRSTEVGIWRSNLDSCFLLLTVARLLSVATLVQQRHEQ